MTASSLPSSGVTIQDQEKSGLWLPSSLGPRPLSHLRAHLVCSLMSSVARASPGAEPGGWCPLGLPGSPAWTNFKDSSCSFHLLATDTGRGGTGGPYPQVQPSEPPEEEREMGSSLWACTGERFPEEYEEGSGALRQCTERDSVHGEFWLGGSPPSHFKSLIPSA